MGFYVAVPYHRGDVLWTCTVYAFDVFIHLGRSEMKLYHMSTSSRLPLQSGNTMSPCPDTKIYRRQSINLDQATKPLCTGSKIMSIIHLGLLFITVCFRRSNNWFTSS